VSRARHRSVAAGIAVLLSLAIPSTTYAAGPPEVVSSAVGAITSSSAVLSAQVNPEGQTTTSRFEYLTEEAYQANLAREPLSEGFQGAALAPAGGAALVGSGTTPTPVNAQQLSNLSPLTAYHYRLVATNGAGTVAGPTHRFATQAATNVVVPIDHRGWEMVSPVDKAGGAVSLPEALFGGGVFQAAANGESVTYSAASSFGAPAGAAVGGQYLSGRTAAGWLTQNISAPALSGSYGSPPDGVPYRLFAAELSSGLLLNGERCRGEAGECPVANQPLPGSGAPPGYQNYYLRNDTTGAVQPLLSQSDLSFTSLTASQLELNFAGSTPELGHAVLSSCAALAPGASEVAAAAGCDPASQNLYEWSGGSLTLLNVLPGGGGGGTPGAALAAPEGAISTSGSRVYWADDDGDLYLNEGGQTESVDESGEAEFQFASTSGDVAFFLRAGHLFRYTVVGRTVSDLVPSGGVQGVLGASADGARVYYQSSAGLFFWEAGTTTEIAADNTAVATDYPPATGSARVSSDGKHLAFLSASDLSGYDAGGFDQLYLYGPPVAGGASAMICVSCNPTGETASGGASISGAVANGSTRAYKPRALSADGQRVFFESPESLAIQDTNKQPDVYEWEGVGEGTCATAPGCVQLISDGRSSGPSTFIDASADGSDVFFLTGESLVPTDPGSIDVYDAREGGGFGVPQSPIPCVADACQILPEAPEDPGPGTLVPNSGNPVLKVSGAPTHKKQKKQKKQKKPHHSKKTKKHAKPKGAKR
jgi:hypothetical protein